MDTASVWHRYDILFLLGAYPLLILSLSLYSLSVSCVSTFIYFFSYSVSVFLRLFISSVIQFLCFYVSIVLQCYSVSGRAVLFRIPLRDSPSGFLACPAVFFLFPCCPSFSWSPFRSFRQAICFLLAADVHYGAGP